MISEPENLASLHKAEWFWHLLAALVSATILALAFPPVSAWYLAWGAFIPILLMPTPRSLIQRCVTGYLFGYVFYAITLYWLNEVQFGVSFLLSLVCALFPMLWYLFYSTWNWHFKDKKTAVFPGGGLLFINSDYLLAATVIVAAAAWVTQEWILSWFCTGFPWNQLGIAFYRHPRLIAIAEFTGVPGISFLVMLINCAIAAEFSRFIRMVISPDKRRLFPWHLSIGALACVIFIIAPFIHPLKGFPKDAQNMRAIAIQGDIPQCRDWSEEDFNLALTVYDELTRNAISQTPDADIVIWPECAVPVGLEQQRYAVMRLKLLRDIKCPLLAGAIQLRLPYKDAPLDNAEMFNSAFLLDSDNRIIQYYDKMHLVPFGEFTPLGDLFPWLRDMIGMGRDLTPGREFKLFNMPNGASAGVNICFEDVFPNPSRQFTLKGANLLMTITNDAWYNRSSGSEQHLAQMIFRAVENRRPFLRIGNNAHSCLVAPNGVILGELPFERTWQAYDIPIGYWGITFYTRHGNIFAHICATISILLLLLFIHSKYKTHSANIIK